MVELADLDTVALVSDLDLKVLEFDLMESDSEVEQESWWGEDAIEDVVSNFLDARSSVGSWRRCFKKLYYFLTKWIYWTAKIVSNVWL